MPKPARRLAAKSSAVAAALPQTRRSQSGVCKASAADLVVGQICADRDGNRVRIDRVDTAAGTLSYHFLNDELRVQEGIQDAAIDNFLSEGWYIATAASL